jgi:hypothetical protein
MRESLQRLIAWYQRQFCLLVLHTQNIQMLIHNQVPVFGGALPNADKNGQLNPSALVAPYDQYVAQLSSDERDRHGPLLIRERRFCRPAHQVVQSRMGSRRIAIHGFSA